jgi:predicted aldo/keto reductase-like oxidoreductase
MQYREMGKTGLKLSALGFGCMRLPKKEDADGNQKIDFEHSHRLFRRAMELGVNYFDSAHMYDNGDSERCLGEFLKEVRRDEMIISTKSPVGHQWWPIPGDKPTGELYRRCLEEELERLGTDHIDIYLFHDTQLLTFRIICKAPGGCLDQAIKAKEEGLIRHIGFSCHDSPENIKKIVDMGNGALDFTIVQYNLLDRKNAPAIEYAREKGVGVGIMGPVGGGRLVHPSEVYSKAVGAASTPEAALRFVLANPGVTSALSGMNAMEQVEENAAAAARAEPLTRARGHRAHREGKPRAAQPLLHRLQLLHALPARHQYPGQLHRDEHPEGQRPRGPGQADVRAPRRRRRGQLRALRRVRRQVPTGH